MQPEHLDRHPFGKVPVLDYDAMRLLETSAITRYLNDVLPGRSVIPTTPKDRARMDMIVGVIDSYGYGSLIGGVAAYHLFPRLRGRTERRRAAEWDRERSQGARTGDADARPISLHRGGRQPRRSFSCADHLLCEPDA